MYQSGVNGFLNFLKLNKFVNLDVSYSQINEEHFIYFVTYCKYVLNLKFETIKLYLAGIRYFLLRYYNTEPLKETPRLDYILKGINKLQVNTSNKRFPITSDVLWKLCDNLQKGMFSPFIDLMLLCIFKMAFFGFLRCGEFTCNERSDSKLFIEDIVFDTKSDIDSYALHLHSSKCDPFHKGVDVIIFENQVSRPVYTMERYIQSRLRQGAVPTSPLFVEHELDFSPLSRSTFIGLLKEALRRSGFNDLLFSGHSFRIGAATSAAAAGVEDHIIKSLGRWNSDCYMRYIRVDKNVMIMAQQDMSSGY